MTNSAYHGNGRRVPQTLREKIEGRLRAAKINSGASAAQPRGNGIFTVTGRESRAAVR